MRARSPVCSAWKGESCVDRLPFVNLIVFAPDRAHQLGNSLAGKFDQLTTTKYIL